MKSGIFDRFDIIMAHLKPLDPTPAFDFEFRNRFEAAIAEKYKESPLEIFTRRAEEGLRYTFLPRVPVFARAAAAFIVFMTIGFCIYSIQPFGPAVVSKKGVVLVRGVKNTGWRDVIHSQRFKIGDVIKTAEGSQLDIEIYNKYAIRIKERTRVEVARLTPRLGKGEAFFKITEGAVLVSIGGGFKGSDFVVDTNTAQAKARGTKFSINISREDKSTTKVSVLEGKVEVSSYYRPERILLAKQTVLVGAGQKTEIQAGQIPGTPQRLIEEEWLQLQELYQLGKKPRVILLIRNTPDRTRQLLGPCPIYISDEKPREIPELFEDAVLKTKDALKTRDKAEHLESIKLLERIVNEHPNPKYDVQFLLYIGAYYEYISLHDDAIRTFKRVVEDYPDSPLASMGLCAIGLIYEEGLHDTNKADTYFRLVLERYPNSLEAIWISKKLGKQ